MSDDEKRKGGGGEGGGGTEKDGQRKTGCSVINSTRRKLFLAHIVAEAAKAE